MDAFDDIALAAWEAGKTPLERMYDAWQPGWDDDRPVEFPTVSLVDRAGLHRANRRGQSGRGNDREE